MFFLGTRGEREECFSLFKFMRRLNGLVILLALGSPGKIRLSCGGVMSEGANVSIGVTRMHV